MPVIDRQEFAKEHEARTCRAREQMVVFRVKTFNLPPGDDLRLVALWQQIKTPGWRRNGQYTPLDHLRDLLIRLRETWPGIQTGLMLAGTKTD
ncbi:MAG: hypothetical protein IMZ61_05615 [Planctomycetes bacterium]|nr:hypothetical protein [Planctomycetota bacterium]